jgi:hypothetical protein
MTIGPGILGRCKGWQIPLGADEFPPGYSAEVAILPEFSCDLDELASGSDQRSSHFRGDSNGYRGTEPDFEFSGAGVFPSGKKAMRHGGVQDSGHDPPMDDSRVSGIEVGTIELGSYRVVFALGETQLQPALTTGATSPATFVMVLMAQGCPTARGCDVLGLQRVAHIGVELGGRWFWQDGGMTPKASDVNILLFVSDTNTNAHVLVFRVKIEGKSRPGFMGL